jgi:hypothetical protein
VPQGVRVRLPPLALTLLRALLLNSWPTLRGMVAFAVDARHDRAGWRGRRESIGGGRSRERHKPRPRPPLRGVKPELIRPHRAAGRAVAIAKPWSGPRLLRVKRRIIGAAHRRHHEPRYHGQQQVAHKHPPKELSAFLARGISRKGVERPPRHDHFFASRDRPAKNAFACRLGKERGAEKSLPPGKRSECAV